MTFKPLTSKDIRLAVKHGNTISELMEEYGFSHEEELFSTIGKIFTKGTDAAKIISAIKKNSKKNKPSRESKQSIPTFATSTSEDPTESVNSQGTVEVLPVETHLAEDPTSSESISSLEAEEQELSQQLMVLETTHKGLVSCHLASKKELLRMQRILAEMQRLIAEHQKNLTCELQKIQKTSDEMAKVSQEAKSISSRLKVVRAKLEELKKISIFVYANGNLELENGEIPHSVCSEEALNSKFTELVLWPRAKEFSVTLKDLTTVAKLLLWTEYLASSGLAFEISFDSEEVQRFYEAVTAPTAPA